MRALAIWTPIHFSRVAVNYSPAPTFLSNRLTHISWYLLCASVYTPVALPGGCSPVSTERLPLTPPASDQVYSSSTKAFPAPLAWVRPRPLCSTPYSNPHAYLSEPCFCLLFSSACPTRMQICIICLTLFCSPGKKFLREFVLSLGVSIPYLPRKAYQKCQWLDVRHGEFSAWGFVPCSQTSILHGGGRLGNIT